MDKKIKILVVDDDPTVRHLLSNRLPAAGYEIITAADGEEGLALYQQEQPDLIILDIVMPKMDGYTFVLEFNKIGNLRKTPIIMLTSKDNMQDIFEVQGVNDYIVKPFEMEDLLQKLDKRLAGKEKKVLIVDDEEDVVTVMANRLKNSGYTVITAYDGLKALDVAKKELPDLIILDVMMPRLNGYNVCRMLKFDNKFKDIPIIFLTALARNDTKNLAEEVGADACITKPYDGKVLLQKMKELLWD